MGFYVAMKNLGKMNWSSANSQCQNYSFCGNVKGTLPTVDQLKSIYQNKSRVNSLLSTNGGTQLTNSYYWSSTGNDNYYVVDMSNGNVNSYSYYLSDRYVRPVLASCSPGPRFMVTFNRHCHPRACPGDPFPKTSSGQGANTVRPLPIFFTSSRYIRHLSFSAPPLLPSTSNPLPPSNQIDKIVYISSLYINPPSTTSCITACASGFAGAITFSVFSSPLFSSSS